METQSVHHRRNRQPHPSIIMTVTITLTIANAMTVTITLTITTPPFSSPTKMKAGNHRERPLQIISDSFYLRVGQSVHTIDIAMREFSNQSGF